MQDNFEILEETKRLIDTIDFVLSGFFLYDSNPSGIISCRVLDASKEEKYQHMESLMDLRHALNKKKEAYETILNG